MFSQFFISSKIYTVTMDVFIDNGLETGESFIVIIQ